MATDTNRGIGARRTPRRVYRHPVGILAAGKYVVQGGLQLSEGGMLFSSMGSGYKVGDKILVTLVLPGGGSVVTRGELLYERSSERRGEKNFGVKFETLSLNMKRSIRNYVTAKTQEEAEAELAERPIEH